MPIVVSLLVSVVAGVLVNRICKWLDRKDKKQQ